MVSKLEHLFRKKRYRWDDVTGFAVRNVGQYDDTLVSFDTAPEVNRSLWDRINGALIGKAAICRTPMGCGRRSGEADDGLEQFRDIGAATRSSTAACITDN